MGGEGGRKGWGVLQSVPSPRPRHLHIPFCRPFGPPGGKSSPLLPVPGPHSSLCWFPELRSQIYGWPLITLPALEPSATAVRSPLGPTRTVAITITDRTPNLKTLTPGPQQLAGTWASRTLLFILSPVPCVALVPERRGPE